MFIGDLRKKTFYGIILMILWKKKAFYQVFWCFDQFSQRSEKLLNSVWVTSYPRIYKTFHYWFSLNIFVNVMQKEPWNNFMVVLTIVPKFWKIKLCLEVKRRQLNFLLYRSDRPLFLTNQNNNNSNTDLKYVFLFPIYFSSIMIFLFWVAMK